MARRIDAETRAAIVEMYLSDDGIRYKDIAEKFDLSVGFVSRTIKKELQAGNGIKPDLRARTIKLPDGIEFEREALEAQHPRTSDWMEHVKPLNAHKRELEQKVEHKQAELEKAKQELRDFTATLRKLMEDTT